MQVFRIHPPLVLTVRSTIPFKSVLDLTIPHIFSSCWDLTSFPWLITRFNAGCISSFSEDKNVHSDFFPLEKPYLFAWMNYYNETPKIKNMISWNAYNYLLNLNIVLIAKDIIKLIYAFLPLQNSQTIGPNHNSLWTLLHDYKYVNIAPLSPNFITKMKTSITITIGIWMKSDSSYKILNKVLFLCIFRLLPLTYSS